MDENSAGDNQFIVSNKITEFFHKMFKLYIKYFLCKSSTNCLNLNCSFIAITITLLLLSSI